MKKLKELRGNFNWCIAIEGLAKLDAVIAAMKGGEADRSNR